ncbi:MAG: alpha/beta hydrolase [Actinobacteria bacterium]|nr:alpha/beta hydrolase [Actinomycetota bacterium]
MAVIALLHAFPLGPAMFEAQRKALVAAGHEVVVPDLLSPERNYPADPDLAAMARYVLKLMSDAGHRQFAIAGLSMGGYVAMAVLRNAMTRVTGLALLDTRASADSDAAARNRYAYADRVESEGMGWVPEATLDSLLGETTRESRAVIVDRVRGWIEAADPGMVAWAQRAMAERPDSLAELQVFRQPSLVLVGQEDTLTPLPDSLAMAEALGGAPLTQISRAGHLSSVESPNKVSEMLTTWADRLD